MVFKSFQLTESVKVSYNGKGILLVIFTNFAEFSIREHERAV